MSKVIGLVAPKPKRSREDNLKIITECSKLIEQHMKDKGKQ